MANHNFKVKKGLEVGTGVTITDGGITAIGIVTALQFSGDGSGLTGVVSASEAGVVIQEEGSSVGTASTINFIGDNVTAALTGGVASVTIGGGDMITDTTPQLGGNLDLNGKNITGIGSISITGGISATGVSTFSENVVFQSTASFGDNDKINLGAGNDLQIYHDGSHSRIKDSGTGSLISQASRFSVHSADDSEVMIDASQNSYVKLYHDNVLRLETTNAGLTITGTASATTFSGSGASLTTLNASELDSGTVPDARFPATLPAASGIALTSLNASNLGIGTIPDARFPATLPTASGTNLTNIPAGQLTGTVADARLSTVSSSKLSGALPALDGSALTDLTGVPAGTYGASALTPIITVDSDGRITGITTVVTSGTGAGSFNNVIEDTTPQLGGNLDLNTKTINGTGNIDITGYAAVSGVSTFSGSVGFATHIHDAGTGGLDIRTNLLRIKNDADSETLATFAENGAVSFYHDNTLKFNTTSTGAVVTGSLTATTIVKSGGSSSQFLKADGSVDTSTYLTSFTETDPIVGAINGIVKANGSGTISAAVAGTDYLTPTGDGSGLTGIAGTAFSNIQASWSVTANGSSAYRFAGPGNDAADNNPDLYLVRGQRYRFTNNSGGSHPFQIRVSNGGSAYSTGVTNNGGASGNIDWNVQWDAPAKLFYQCTAHSGMVGNIYIIGGPQVISGVVTATSFSGSGASLTSVNATTLDSIDSGSFLRSDADDTLTGNLQINSHVINMDLNGVDDNAIELREVNEGTWPFQFVTNDVGNDNPSGFWVASTTGYPDMRLRKDNGTVRALISSWETSYVSNGFNVTGTLAISKDGDALNLRSTTNAVPVRITFSSQNPTSQIGHIEYTHSDSASYGSNEAFILSGTEANRTILADGKLMYSEGIYSKPGSGTGAGTRKDANWDTAYGWGDHSAAGYISGSGFAQLSGATFTGDLRVDNDADLRIGDGSANERILIQKADNNVSDHIIFYNGTTRMGEIGCEDTTWLRINQETAKNIYTARYIRADGGFFVDGTAKGINGSGNFIGGTIAGASDYSTLLRSDADDSASGTITFNGRVNIRGHLDFADSEYAYFGSSDDWSIYRNSNNWTYINDIGNGIIFQDNGTNVMRLEDSAIFRPESDGGGSVGTSAVRWANGYFDAMDITGTINVRGAVDLADNDILRLGSGDDAELFCNGSHLYLDLNSGIGNFYIRDGSTTRYTFNDNGSFTATGNVTAYSDIKLKENIEPIVNSLDKVNQINGVTFDRIDTPELGRQMGVIAQDVEKVCPELVSTDEEGTKSVAYGNMVGLLIEAIKDQQKQIDELRAKLEEK